MFSSTWQAALDLYTCCQETGLHSLGWISRVNYPVELYSAFGIFRLWKCSELVRFLAHKVDSGLVCTSDFVVWERRQIMTGNAPDRNVATEKKRKRRTFLLSVGDDRALSQVSCMRFSLRWNGMSYS